MLVNLSFQIKDLISRKVFCVYFSAKLLMLDKNNNGILLFGTNASGKSSLMKAIGINLIMAQAGFYVAATKFVFYPYKYL